MMDSSLVKVSVIIPVYNGGDGVLECLQNLNEQDTNEPFEVIIVDDASTDDSVEIIKGFLQTTQKPEVFRLIECEKNGRAGTARNIGMKASKGEYLLFVDQDDYPDRKLISELLKLSENGKYDMVSCALTDKDGSVLKRPDLVRKENISDELKSEIMRPYGYVFATLFRRSMLMDHGLRFAENVFFEDVLFYCGTISCAKSINNTEQVLYYRKQDENSQSASFSIRKLNDRIDSTLQYLNMLKGVPETENCKTAIDLMAFYYIYLSVTVWLCCMPHLFDKATFQKALAEGKKLNNDWELVKITEKGYSPVVLAALKTIYDHPWMVYPARVVGRAAYQIVHSRNIRKRGK